MTVKVKFLGAAGTVTGSKYLVKGSNSTVLIDVGLFQGKREWRERNWHQPEIELKTIDAVLLTHAHIDHTGLLPRYHHLGLNCPVYCTKSTQGLSEVLLPDSAYLQEEEAEWRNRNGKSRHSPALPLYTKKDAASVLKLFRSVEVEREVEVAPGVTASWSRMGHILGAAAITLKIEGKTITFSGDIGRYNVPILKNPQPVEYGDLLLIESTYGARIHNESDPRDKLAEIITATEKRNGMVVIPSFAVGRAQLLLYYLRELKEAKKIPNIPVIIDSPMATTATEIYRSNPKDYDDEALEIFTGGREPFSPDKIYFTKSQQESKKLNSIVDPMIVISASGMLSGGRVLHHLRQRISSPKNTVVFVGYQPPGGRGDHIQSGAETLKLFGEEIPIRAEIDTISGLSAHGDRDEMIKWCGSCMSSKSSPQPKKVSVVHGEPDSALSFAKTLSEKFSWNTSVPHYLDEVVVE